MAYSRIRFEIQNSATMTLVHFFLSNALDDMSVGAVEHEVDDVDVRVNAAVYVGCAHAFNVDSELFGLCREAIVS